MLHGGVSGFIDHLFNHARKRFFLVCLAIIVAPAVEQVPEGYTAPGTEHRGIAESRKRNGHQHSHDHHNPGMVVDERAEEDELDAEENEYECKIEGLETLHTYAATAPEVNDVAELGFGVDGIDDAERQQQEHLERNNRAEDYYR